MELDEQFLHQARRQVIKLTGHLLDARRGLFLSIKHATLVASYNETTKAIEGNVLALVDGIIETVSLCAIAADQFKKQMKEPEATPPPLTGDSGKHLTPLQRTLEREGVVFETIPKSVPTKTEKRLPKILKFTLRTPKPRNRRKSRDNPPL